MDQNTTTPDAHNERADAADAMALDMGDDAQTEATNKKPDAGRRAELAVVTGGSSGIGLELAREAIARGFDVVLVAEELAGLNRAAADLQRPGVVVRTVVSDLASREGVEALLQELRDMDRPVGLLCANAGVGVGGPFLENDLDAELNLISLNVVGQVHLLKRVLQQMQDVGGGRVLITSSIAGTMPGPYEAVYAASKAFLASLGAALVNELQDSPISITVLMPGATETNFFHRASMDDTPVGRGEKDDPADVARQGFDALMQADDRVVAGMKNKAQVAMGTVLPETAKAEMHRKQAEPDSERKRQDDAKSASRQGGQSGGSQHK